MVNCSLWGPTCDSFDKVADNLTFPKLAEDDFLLWRDMGAYTLSTQTVEFNGMPSPTRFYFNQNEVELELENELPERTKNRFVAAKIEHKNAENVIFVS